MNAVIMAGGFGTRLRPLTASLPKPMVPVGGKPLMQHVVERLVRHDLKQQVALLFFQPATISGYFGDGSRFDASMRYRRAEADYGTAGSVKNAEDLLDDRLLIISGDVLTDFDLKQAIQFHESKGALVTMVLTRLPNPLAYGVVITDADGRITQFLEKPSWGEVISDTVNTGIYIIEKEAISALPAKTFVDFSQNMFPRLLAEGAPMYGYIASGYWRDIGNPDEYILAHRDIFAGTVDVALPGTFSERDGARVYCDDSARIADDAKLSGTVVVGPQTQIRAGAVIEDAIVGPGCMIGTRARLFGSVLWHDVEIGAEAHIRQAVLCNDVRIGKGSQIGEQTVISEKVRTGDDVQVRPNVRIWPGKDIEQGATVTDSLVWGDKFNRELFTDAKVTGIFNREFTPEFAVRVGGAWGAHIGTGRVVLASRDESPASRLLTRSMVSGLCAAGVNVHDLRTVPIPVLRHLLSVGMYAGGLHIRRNPEKPEASDLIVLDANGRDLSNHEAKSIERLFRREDYYRADIENTGRIDYPIRVLEGYRAAFMSAVDADLLRGRGFKMVVDYQGGIGSGVLSPLLTQLGVDAVTIDAGGARMNATTKNRDAFSRSQVAAVVQSLHADIGVIIHPQAEKMTLVDETGEVLGPLELQRVVGYLFMSQHPETTLATPVVGSQALDDMAAQFNVKIVRLRNDHQAMIQAYTDGADLVVGTRGGLISGAFGPGADALFGALYIMELLARSGASLSAARKKVEGFVYASASAHCPWDKRGQVMRHLAEWAKENNAAMLDGVRAVEKEGWLWIGPDRYKAQFNIVAESRKPDYVQARLTEAAERVSSWQKEPV